MRCFSVTGYSGGSVLVDTVRSSPNNIQYLQKQTNGKWDIIIDNKKQANLINKGRYALYLNKNRNVMLLIRELNAQDSGRYKIGLSGSEVTEIDLKVIEGE